MEGKEVIESDYETYGDAWKKEMTKLPKAIIIDLASKIGKDKEVIQSANADLDQRLKEAVQIIKTLKSTCEECIDEFNSPTVNDFITNNEKK